MVYMILKLRYSAISPKRIDQDTPQAPIRRRVAHRVILISSIPTHLPTAHLGRPGGFNTYKKGFLSRFLSLCSEVVLKSLIPNSPLAIPLE